MHSEQRAYEAPFFAGLSPESRRALVHIGVARRFPKDAVLFHEGSSGEGVWLLTSGAVQLHTALADGRMNVVRLLKPGEMFAEVVLFETPLYPVTAVARRASEAVIYPKDRFLRLLNAPAFRHDFIANLMRKLRYLVGQLESAHTLSVEERLTRFLNEQHGPATRIAPALSKKDTALAIHAAPETFSRLLARLKKEKKLIWDKTGIRVAPAFWQATPGRDVATPPRGAP